MKRNKIVAMFASVAVMATTSVFAQTGPDEVVKTAATSVTTVLKSDPAILGNAAKLDNVINLVCGKVVEAGRVGVVGFGNAVKAAHHEVCRKSVLLCVLVRILQHASNRNDID